MEDLSKYQDDFVLFLEAGFIAINQADEDSAMKLLKACELLKPENSLTKVAMGYLHFHKLELAQAVKCYDEVLSKEPDNEMAIALKGVALSLSPEKGMEGEKLLESTVKGSSDSQIKKVCNSTLDFVDEFVKKTPGPAEIRKNK